MVKKSLYTLQTHEEIYTYAFAEDLDLITDRDRYTTAMNRLLKKVDPDRRDSKLIFSHRGRGYRLQYGLDDIIE